MKILVRSRNIALSSQLESTIAQHVAAGLDRHEHAIRRVLVELFDINGPRGGVDTRCRIHVALQRGGIASVVGLDTTPVASVDAATNRARRRVGRLIEGARGARTLRERRGPGDAEVAS